MIDSGAVGVMKPDPRIFHLALDAMGIDAADAWYVGDMPGIDVIGARAAGLHPVLMDPYEFHLDADYDRIGSLTELADRITGAGSSSRGRFPGRMTGMDLQGKITRSSPVAPTASASTPRRRLYDKGADRRARRHRRDARQIGSRPHGRPARSVLVPTSRRRSNSTRPWRKPCARSDVSTS